MSPVAEADRAAPSRERLTLARDLFADPSHVCADHYVFSPNLDSAAPTPDDVKAGRVRACATGMLGIVAGVRPSHGDRTPEAALVIAEAAKMLDSGEAVGADVNVEPRRREITSAAESMDVYGAPEGPLCALNNASHEATLTAFNRAIEALPGGAA